MKILSIDTVTSVLSITAAGPSGTTTVTVDSGAQHAERLLPAIQSAMELSGIEPANVDLVVCAEGPGSFTGLRLGYSTAKAFQLAAGCPLIPVSPLVCYSRPFAEWPGAVVSVLDAKKGRYYAQVFRKGEPACGALDADAADIMRLVDAEERVLFTGPDAEQFGEVFSGLFPTVSLTVIPSGLEGISSEMAKIVQTGISGYTVGVSDQAGPVYVRKSDAENKHT